MKVQADLPFSFLDSEIERLTCVFPKAGKPKFSNQTCHKWAVHRWMCLFFSSFFSAVTGSESLGCNHFGHHGTAYKRVTTPRCLDVCLTVCS